MNIEVMKQWLKSLQWAMHIYQGINPPHLIESVLSLEKAIAEVEMIQAAAQSREIKLAMAEANDRRLEAERQKQDEPVGEAYLCDKCQTPFDMDWLCPSCGHNMATKEPVYIMPQQRKPLTDVQYFEIGQRHWLPSSKVQQIHKEIIEASHKTKEQ